MSSKTKWLSLEMSRTFPARREELCQRTELWTLRLLISTSSLEAHSCVYLLVDDIQRPRKDEFPFQSKYSLTKEHLLSSESIILRPLVSPDRDCRLELIFYIRRLLPRVNIEFILKYTRM